MKIQDKTFSIYECFYCKTTDCSTLEFKTINYCNKAVCFKCRINPQPPKLPPQKDNSYEDHSYPTDDDYSSTDWGWGVVDDSKDGS